MAKSEGEEASRMLYEQIVAYVEKMEKYLENPNQQLENDPIRDNPDEVLAQAQLLLTQVNTLLETDKNIRKSMGINESSFISQIEEAKRKSSGRDGKLNEKIEKLKNKIHDMEDQVKRELHAQENRSPPPKTEKKGTEKKKKLGQKGSYRRSIGDDQWKKL